MPSLRSITAVEGVIEAGPSVVSSDRHAFDRSDYGTHTSDVIGNDNAPNSPEVSLMGGPKPVGPVDPEG